MPVLTRIAHKVRTSLTAGRRGKPTIIPAKRDWLVLLCLSVTIFLLFALLASRAFYKVDEGGFFPAEKAEARPAYIVDQERLSELLFELELERQNFERLKAEPPAFPLPY